MFAVFLLWSHLQGRMGSPLPVPALAQPAWNRDGTGALARVADLGQQRAVQQLRARAQVQVSWQVVGSSYLSRGSLLHHQPFFVLVSGTNG